MGNYKLENEIHQLEIPASLVLVQYSSDTVHSDSRILDVSKWQPNATTTPIPHRHRIDKYPDIQLNNQTTRKTSPPIILKVAIARWRTARVIISLILPNQSQRSRSSAIANDMSSAVCRIAKYGMQNLRPSCDYHCSSGFGFVYG